MSHLRAVVLSVQLLIYLLTFRPFVSVKKAKSFADICGQNKVCTKKRHFNDIARFGPYFSGLGYQLIPKCDST